MSESTASARRKRHPRNAAETRERLLHAATQEFCEYGYDGARMERIVATAECNIRMAYHYFGDKEGLYLAVLERVYTELREREQQLHLDGLEPVAAVQRLVEFTFDHFAGHPELFCLIRNENLLGGRMLKRSGLVTQQTTPLLAMIDGVLARGERGGQFRPRVDALQLYISIVALAQTHVSNRATLSILFNQDLADPAWLAGRRQHTVEVILAYLERREPSAG